MIPSELSNAPTCAACGLPIDLSASRLNSRQRKAVVVHAACVPREAVELSRVRRRTRLLVRLGFKR